MGLSMFGFQRFFEHQGSSNIDTDSFGENDFRLGQIRIKPDPDTKILVIDDSKTVHKLLAGMLEKYGYQVVSAYDGETGIDMARKYRPTLMIIDVMMPGISGFQVTRQVRKDSDPELAKTPIVIMSGNPEATDQFWSQKIGANDFLTKPFDENGVLNVVEKVLYAASV